MKYKVSKLFLDVETCTSNQKFTTTVHHKETMNNVY